ncbi:MAG: N-acetylmuramoyl-L-alanine amidase [Butyricicoccus pullicaecorum]|nr:N-acetylmuramoyl-L-alanine amidase [Butyricicoccus pullicaecorum]
MNRMAEYFKQRWFYWIAIGLLVFLLFDQLYAVPRMRVFGAHHEVETLVLDAGHGGFDGGAVSPNGVTEQEINLHVTKKVESLAGLFGIPTELTRKDGNALDYEAGRSVRENKVADIKARQHICEQIQNPVFISIHLNKFEQSRYFGAQVFYGEKNAQSKAIAESIQEALKSGIANGNHRVAKPAGDSIYLMRTLTCPALIVECGFLSNPEDEAALVQDTYQTQLAVCILAGYLQA